MSEASKTKVIVLRETLAESIMSDLFTFGCAIGFTYLAKIAGGGGMYVVAVFMLMALIFGKIYKIIQNNPKLTIEQAQQKLSELAAQKPLNKDNP